MIRKKYKLFSILLISSILIPNKALGAEKITLYKGNFSRTILVNDLKIFAKTKKPKQQLKNIMKMTNQKPEDVLELISQKIEMPLILTNRLLYSSIGNAVLEQVGKIIYPNKHRNSGISTLAIRAAIIKSIKRGNEKVDLIGFLEAYPNKNVAINISALYKTISKVESMSELVNFFSNSPFKKLKEGNSTIRFKES